MSLIVNVVLGAGVEPALQEWKSWELTDIRTEQNNFEYIL